MRMTPDQVKGKIKNIAKLNNADARTLMRLFMMERFLERVAVSKYKDNFIIKGGMLVTAMVGVALRSTMDIDTTIKNQALSESEAKRIVDEISKIDIGDGVTFEIKSVSTIMDDMEYPGIRITMNAVMENLITPIKIDISTDDVITPHAAEFEYKLLLEERSISLWSYNLETILAEKLQTVLAHGILNTRMRDFYDIYTLLSIYEKKIDGDILLKAFTSTCNKRGTDNLSELAYDTLEKLRDNIDLQKYWKSYQQKYTYASEISYEDIMHSLEKIANKIIPKE
jgi:predicted nucleotidyltransferase component of viral defense system